MHQTLFPLLAALTLTLTVVLGADDAREPAAPQAKKVPHVTRIHGEEIVDNYRWLQDKKKPEVIAHLEAENAYTKAKTKHLDATAETLYQEALARMQQTDQGVPVPNRGYLYYTR